MSVKSWVLQRVQGIGRAARRADLPTRDTLPSREPELEGAAAEVRARAGLFAEPALASAEQLGAYAPLIDALREELEHFVASHVRLHVVIADRDRFVLTAIGVRSPGGPGTRERLQQFMREFRPEQVKRYISREVIGRLPNAAVIDLSQFAGLSDLEAHSSEAGDEYAELIAALRTEATPAASPYEISVLGRWTEADAQPVDNGGGRGRPTPSTPLAGKRATFELDDGEGQRQAVLNTVAPGRRYVVGKGLDCDIPISGTYTSRRHAELWTERGAWFVCDAGSTNGIRVEPPAGSSEQVAISGGNGGRASDLRVLPVQAGSRIVFSARAEGPPSDYPWLALRHAVAQAGGAQPASVAPMAAATLQVPVTEAEVRVPAAAEARAPEPRQPSAVPSTPRTAVLHTRALEPAFVIGESSEGSERKHVVRASELPISIGRSRGQTIVIDWRHAGVSGHHVEIDRLDADAAEGIVHGDNGVAIGTFLVDPGTRFRWAAGETMVLGGALPGEPPCALTLVRRQGN